MRSEYRFDPLQQRWSLIAEERAERPIEFPQPVFAERVLESSFTCPFCPGNESQTPPPVHVVGRPDWRLRVFPNKFPMLRPDQEASLGNAAGFFVPPSPTANAAAPGVGRHEVIVETPEHASRLADRSITAIVELLHAYRDRMAATLAGRTIRFVSLFRNDGPAAGASLSHPHSQLVGLTAMPPALQSLLAAWNSHFQAEQSSLLETTLATERDDGRRWLSDNDDVVAFCPYGSRFAYQVYVAPRRHAADFRDADDRVLASCAEVLRDVLARLDRRLQNPAFNLLLHSVPESPAFHWYFEICPRITGVAGFEWSTGLHLNAVTPERAARELAGV